MRAVGLRIKKIRRRFGIAAPKVVIRSHVPWWWLLFSGVLLLFLSGILIWFFLQQGQAGALRHEVEVLRHGVWITGVASVVRPGDPRWLEAHRAYQGALPHVGVASDDLFVLVDLRRSHRAL